MRRDPTLYAHYGQGPENSLISVEEARNRILSRISPVGEEIIDLSHASGRVLAKAQYSAIDLPQFNNSSMDGFAVRYTDVSGARPDYPVELTVIGDIPAGQVLEGQVAEHQAARIMTGAQLPHGADAIVPVEDTDHLDSLPGAPLPAKVKIYRAASPNQYIRPKGQDVAQGELVLEPGKPLRPQEIGFLASMGISSLPVYRRARVAFFSTGDELIALDEPVSIGKIFESNSFMLAALIEKYHAEPLFLGILPDQEAEIRACLEKAVRCQADLIISTAGVSVGALDFVRSVVEVDGKIEFWRVNMQPGKPVAFGEFQGIPFIGLPGNPVSSFVGAELFVRPMLLKMGGRCSWNRPYFFVRLLEGIESDGRESYLRAFVRLENEDWVASLTGHQGSGNLRSLVQANALLLVPSGVKSLPIGTVVRAYFLEDA